MAHPGMAHVPTLTRLTTSLTVESTALTVLHAQPS